MRLDEREIPSCMKEVEGSSSAPFMRTDGMSGLHLREMTPRAVLLSVTETRLSLP